MRKVGGSNPSMSTITGPPRKGWFSFVLIKNAHFSMKKVLKIYLFKNGNNWVFYCILLYFDVFSGIFSNKCGKMWKLFSARGNWLSIVSTKFQSKIYSKYTTLKTAFSVAQAHLTPWSTNILQIGIFFLRVGVDLTSSLDCIIKVVMIIDIGCRSDVCMAHQCLSFS